MNVNATYSSAMRDDHCPTARRRRYIVGYGEDRFAWLQVISEDDAPFEAISYACDALSRNGDTFGYNARNEVISHNAAGYAPQDYSYDEIGNNAWLGTNCLNQQDVGCVSMPEQERRC